MPPSIPTPRHRVRRRPRPAIEPPSTPAFRSTLHHTFTSTPPAPPRATVDSRLSTSTLTLIVIESRLQIDVADAPTSASIPASR
uniref:Uncharacterized protein n=1 Tax=Oryza rufipogon TaxID=4529 RepID=A0A0E0P1L4_ORYRU